MKLSGFINGAYKLDSVNADSQRCVNLYPEIIESGSGKGAQKGYLQPTPGLDLFQTVGDGPIRMVHRDSQGRILVASGNKLYRVAARADWSFWLWFATAYDVTNIDQSTDINTGTDVITSTGHAFITGQRVWVSSTATLPTGLSASTNYFISKVDANSFKLTDVDEFVIDITGLGSGTMSVTSQVSGANVYGASTYTSIDYVDDVDFTNDQITITNHGLHNGAQMYLSSFAVPLPGNLSHLYSGGTIVYYYVKYVDANTIELCTSLANVIAGTIVDLTNDASSYSIIQCMFWATRDPDYLPGTYGLEFTNSTGIVIGRSSNTDNTDANSTSILTDGSYSYVIFFDDSNGGMQALQSFGLGYVGALFLSTHVAWIDGYYILNEVATGKFWVSGLNDITLSPLDYAASEGSPDLVVGLIENVRDLWVFNERSTEIFVNTGNPDFPFERVQGGFFEVGCVAKYSIAKISGVVFWLGRGEFGEGVVYMNYGLQPKRISTHPIEQEIIGYADISAATSYTYEHKGHYFYVLNFSEGSWSYDLSTGIWHERAYTNSGVLERHLGDVHCFNQDENAHLIGDYTNGNLYKFNESTYTDNSVVITRLRSTPHYSSEDDNLICDRLRLDIESGVGLVSGQGNDPQIMLDFSDDGGHTWSNERWRSFGAIGKYAKRVVWNRLGRFRDRIFRFKVTDPVKVVFIDAFMKFRKGRN